MSNTTQKEVEKLAKKIKNGIDNINTFLNQNYSILKKKRQNTRLERIFIENQEENNLFYQSPENINMFVETVCFYMAMEQLKIPFDEW